MLKQKLKHVELKVALSYEEYHELKLAIFYVSMDTVSGEQTQRGRDGLYLLMNHILPAMEDERDAVIRVFKTIQK